MKTQQTTNHGIELLAEVLTDDGIEAFIERVFNQFQQPFRVLAMERIAGAIFFDVETEDGEMHVVAA